MGFAHVDRYVRQLQNNKRRTSDRAKRAKRKAEQKLLEGKELTEKDEALLEGEKLYKKGVPVKTLLQQWREKKKNNSDLIPEKNDLTELQEMISEARMAQLMQAATYDVMDPAVLDGDVTLPSDVLALMVEKGDDFSEDDLRNILVKLSRDNIAHLVALLRSKDDESCIETWKLLLKAVVGEKKQVDNTHSGYDGGPVVIELVPVGGKVPDA